VADDHNVDVGLLLLTVGAIPVSLDSSTMDDLDYKDVMKIFFMSASDLPHGDGCV